MKQKTAQTRRVTREDPEARRESRHRKKQSEERWERIHEWTVRIAVPVIIMLAIALVLRLTIR